MMQPFTFHLFVFLLLIFPFCLQFDFSERSTLLSKIEKRDAENSLQNAQVGKIYCPSEYNTMYFTHSDNVI